MDKAILDKIASLKIVPVVKIDNAEDAEPLAEALCKGGLPVAEITFRTSAAVEAIKAMKKNPAMFVGAGTVTNLEQAKQAVDAGAEFMVTPGFSQKVTEFAVNNNIPILPGICTATEIMMLLEYGLPVAKFFPAEQYGGINTIKALSGPFPDLKFMPTGGIGPSNIFNYLALPQIIACSGSWMVKDHLISSHKFGEIEKLTKRAVQLVK